MAFPLTEEQRSIVDDRGGELLVSAAAGSGKTRVLVERLLDRVTGEGLDIDRFLVITYTKAAAAELRTRIAQELADRLAERPNDRHLRRQTTLVYQAQISTIHSFCSTLLRESGHLLDLDPDFRLCDEGEAQVLMVRTLEDVLDRRYEGLDPEGPFAQLSDTMAAGRDDSRLVQIALDIYGRVQSHPDPEQWLREQKQVWALEGVSDLAQTAWGRVLLEDARRQGRWCRDRMEQALQLAQSDELLSANYGPSIVESLDGLESFLRAEDWDQAAACLPIPFPAVGRKKKRSIEISPMEEEKALLAGERVKAIRNRCKKLMDKVGEQLSDSSTVLLEELALSRPAVQALMDLVIDFKTAYDQEKRRRNLIDFSDLEHFAVQLLVDEKGQPTPLAHSWSARFAEIQVDEYQDTNQVQNAIFSAISDGGRKLFQVGDVKQSIYRFRLADPTIFLDKYRRFADGDLAGEGEARRRVLSCNFRSRAQVLEGCNDLFRNIMSVEFGELDYTEDQALVPGATFPVGEQYALELDALDLSFLGDQEGEKDNKDLLEARFAARRIRAMLDQPLMIQEGGGLRPVRPSDVMILLRSPGSSMRHYLKALGEEGIPWSADGGSDLFDTTEVNVALSILQIVDNPRQDIPLLAALRSPVYGFTGDRLALLRAGRKGDFYSALVQAADRGEEDCIRFLAQLAELRFGAGDRTCRQLIWHIYEQTNLLGIFGAMDRGQERRDNLLALYGLAGQMEESGCRSLFQFLLRLERLRSNGTKLNVSGSAREGEGVSILSIHRSKGLEKPVVLVCGLSRRLNRDDLMGPVLFHPVLGVGPKGLDRERMVEYPTLARRAVARQLEREMMAEELRLLYVAMTRAKEKLILSVALPEGRRALERLREDLSAPVSPIVLENQQNVGQWVLLHALTRREAGELRDMAYLPEVVCQDQGPDWEVRWVDGTSLSMAHRAGRFVDLPADRQEAQIDGLRERFQWRYPYAASVDIPSKLTATQIKGRAQDQEAAEEGAALPGQPKHDRLLSRPDFAVQERGLTPAQRGTALHQAMQYIPLQGGHSVAEMRAALDRLVAEGFLTKLQGGAVQPERLSAFFQSELGQEVLRAETCCREFKFSLLVPAKDYFPQADGAEEVLLQGVIDLWFEDERGITVVDFKSDHIAPGEEQRQGAEHRLQLEAYSVALAQILERPVRRKVLWFFATNTALEL
jgi:ATP-dependent helicase/nuclease subunit A